MVKSTKTNKKVTLPVAPIPELRKPRSYLSIEKNPDYYQLVRIDIDSAGFSTITVLHRDLPAIVLGKFMEALRRS